LDNLAIKICSILGALRTGLYKTAAVNSVVKLFKKVDLLKTVYFNFHYFPFKVAVRMPFFIYKRSELYLMKGKIIIDAPVKTGMVKLGPHGLGTQDLLYSRTMWQVAGTLVVKGKTNIGRGCKISVGKEAVLTLGKDFQITGNSEIICQKEITFGNDCLLSWDILMMDTDFHQIVNEGGEIINAPMPISIGNHVWIGCRNTILKGVTIADNNVVSANSTVTRSIDESNCVIGGHGKTVGVIKRGVGWRH